MYNLQMSNTVEPLVRDTRKFIDEEIEPRTSQFFALSNTQSDPMRPHPLQVATLEDLKTKARARQLWNLFLPRSPQTPDRLSNLDQAYLAGEMGRNPLASECFNCSAPDSGVMEILEQFGTPEQKERWLARLLSGQARSAFALTEPGIASSDAGNIRARAALQDGEWVINGIKSYVCGVLDPRCEMLICVAQTSVDAPAHRRQSQIIVPLDSPGLHIDNATPLCGHNDPPRGYAHITLNDVRVPEKNVILGEGRGFDISQNLLTRVRVQHCMRAIGAAERAYDLMGRRSVSRTAFGKPLAQLGKNLEILSRSRFEIESMRLMALRAARALDVLDEREARMWVHSLKAMVPAMAADVVDRSIQMHGADGLSPDTPLWQIYINLRALRIADGPDDVHHFVVGRNEAKKYAALDQ